MSKIIFSTLTPMEFQNAIVKAVDKAINLKLEKILSKKLKDFEMKIYSEDEIEKIK